MAQCASQTSISIKAIAFSLFLCEQKHVFITFLWHSKVLSRFFLVFQLLALLIPLAANAAAITNLDTVAHNIQLQDGEAFETIAIEPNATWRKPGTVKVRYDGRDLLIHYYEDYAIWEGGVMGPQRSVYTAGGLNR